MAGEPTATPNDPWHARGREEVAATLGVDPAVGLGGTSVAERRARYGSNGLPEAPPRPLWRVFVAQLTSFLILVLMGAAILAAIVGDPKDALVIVAVLFLNAILGTAQESRAERSHRALRAMLAARAIVRRDGQRLEIDANDVVPGDVLVVSAGERVPADGRLWLGRDLEVDESLLTGEALAVSKDEREILDADTHEGERRNFVCRGTLVTRGRGEVLVTETGARTRVGRVAALVAGVEPRKTPLMRELDDLGRKLALVALAVVVVVLVAEIARGEPLVEALLVAVALAVAAVPEGLPTVVTVTLALGMRRMAKRGAIVKRLASVETLGCTSVICSDKTGTLTLNRMTVRALVLDAAAFDARDDGAGFAELGSGAPMDDGAREGARLLARAAALASDGAGPVGSLGDPMEAAMHAFHGALEDAPLSLERAGPRVAELPFDATTRRMVVFHREDGRVRLYAKGAPEVLLALSSRVRGVDGGVRPLDAADRAALLAANARLAARAMRVLAVATADLDEGALGDGGREALEKTTAKLTWLGLLGLYDPPRPEAKAAIERCRAAGISVKMVTGDQRATGVAIATELGLVGDALTGSDVDALSDDALRARAPEVAVFARMLPEHKLRIVEALRHAGRVVAMTGDGVNDAPALRAADIGVSMGRSGSDVSREAAAMVLTDDRLDTIEHAIAEGRTIYDNLRSFVRFQLSTNVGAILAVLVAPLVGLPLPLHAVQILFVNLVGDGPPGLALGTDPPRPGLMASPPRAPSARILSARELLVLLGVGAVMAAGCLGILAWASGHRPVAEAQTLAFTTFVLFQVLNVLGARARGRSMFRLETLRNPRLLGAVLLVVLFQVAIVHWPPAAALMHTVPLSLQDWLAAAAVASSIVVVREVGLLAARALPGCR